jgi:large subunit ribosomal protein L29
MKSTELRQKDVAALQTEVKAMQKATQQLTNTATLRSARRDIARAKTILGQQQAATTTAK